MLSCRKLAKVRSVSMRWGTPPLQEWDQGAMETQPSQEFSTYFDRLIVCIRMCVSWLEISGAAAVVLHLVQHEPKFAMWIYLDVASGEREKDLLPRSTNLIYPDQQQTALSAESSKTSMVGSDFLRSAC
jgi:hypothetical protein